MTAANAVRSAAQAGGPAARRVRVIWNAGAGSKAGISTNSTSEEEMRALMERHGLGDELIASESEEHAIELAREAAASGYDLIVAAGGDGTVGTVASALLGTETALGILPLGSVMNMARSLDIPRDLEGAAEVIETGQVRAVDVGEANGKLFFEAASVGLHAAVFSESERLEKGDYRSLLSALRTLIRYRPHRMRLELDEGVISTRALMVTVSNGPYMGLAFTVAPDARLDDGRFDVNVYRGFSRWELVRHLGSIARGRRSYHPKVSTYRSARVHIESRRPLPCRLDGLDFGTTPLTLVTRKRALRIVVPHAAEALS